MRLLYFIPLLSTKGGQERTLTDKANWLQERGHEVMFVTYEHAGELAYPLHEGVQHVDLNCHFFALYKYPLYRRWLEALKLKRLLRRKMQEVIQAFRPDLIVVAIPNTENFLCDVMAVAQDIPVVIESHLAQGHEVIRRGATERWLYWLYPPIRAIRKAHLLIALTEGDAQCWKCKQVERVRVIANPLTCYPTAFPVGQKEKGHIICVGRLTPQKRFDRLIEAFALISAKHPEWHVDIYGDGEERQQLTDLIRSKELQNRIHLLQPTNDIYAAYQRSEFFVLSSDFEGFGLVIVEAMACGLPVVSTDCPFGPSEIIEDGKTGLLAKMDVKDLAEKMEWLITHEEERMAMGIAARQAAARYQKEVIMPQWEQAYSEMANVTPRESVANR